MPYRRLYRYLLVFLKAKSAGDPARVPVTLASTLTILKRGAWTQGSGNDSAGAGATITVHNRGEIVAGDTIAINVTGGNTRTVASVTATTIVTQAGGSGAFVWADGDRIIATSGKPTIYSDEQGVETVASKTTDANGNAAFYLKKRWADVLLSDTGVVSGTYDVEGETETETITPEDFGAVRDNSTNDGAAFTAAIAYLKAMGGGVLQLGAGTYRMATAQTLDFNNITIRGMGRGVTTLNCNASITAFTILGTDVAFEDISFTRTSGIPTYFSVSSGSVRVALRRCNFAGGGQVMNDSGADTILDNIEVFGGSNWLGVYYAAGAARARLTNVKVRNETTASVSFLFYIDTDSIGITFTACDFYVTSPGTGTVVPMIYIAKDSAGTNEPRDIKFVGCRFCPGQGADAVTINDGRGLHFIGCTIEDALNGYIIAGGKVIKITGGLIVGCREEGIDINGGSHIRISGVDISDINQANSGKSYIDVAAGVDDVSVFDVTVGTFVRASAQSGVYAVNVAAGVSDRVQVLGLRSDGSLISGLISNASTSQLGDYSHNIDSVGNVYHSAGINKDQDGTPLIGTKFMTGAETTTDVRNIHTLYLLQSGNTVWLNLTNGINSQLVRIQNISGSFTATFNNAGNFRLSGNHVLDTGDSLWLMYSTNLGVWVEQNFQAT